MSKVFKSVNLFDFVDNTPVQTKSQVKWQKKFIEKSKLIHGDKYDYSKVVYKNNVTKVKIICPIHGEFEQSPGGHLNQKQGCPQCYMNSKNLTTDEFIQKAKKVHGDRYGYSKVDYIHSKTKIKIICPIHGEFEQTPNLHLNGCGCTECNDKKKSTTPKFIKKATEIHGHKYDYSLVEYKRCDKKVKIICPIHGEFEQTPKSHLAGCGCQKCGILKTSGNIKFNSGKYELKCPDKYELDRKDVFYHSSYELKAFQMIEDDRSIISWCAETVIVPYELNGNKHDYYVDLKLKTKDKTILVEVKPEIQTKKPITENLYYNTDIWNKNQAKWKEAKDYCLSRGWEFEIWTEKELNI